MDEYFELMKNFVKWFVSVRNLRLWTEYFFGIVPEADEHFVFDGGGSKIQGYMVSFQEELKNLVLKESLWKF